MAGECDTREGVCSWSHCNVEDVICVDGHWMVSMVAVGCKACFCSVWCFMSIDVFLVTTIMWGRLEPGYTMESYTNNNAIESKKSNFWKCWLSSKYWPGHCESILCSSSNKNNGSFCIYLSITWTSHPKANTSNGAEIYWDSSLHFCAHIAGMEHVPKAFWRTRPYRCGNPGQNINCWRNSAVRQYQGREWMAGVPSQDCIRTESVEGI